MFVVYDVLNHKWRSIVWTLDKARASKTTQFRVIAEISSDLADLMIDDIKQISRSTFHEGIARYANRSN